MIVVFVGQTIATGKGVGSLPQTLHKGSTGIHVRNSTVLSMGKGQGEGRVGVVRKDVMWELHAYTSKNKKGLCKETGG